LARGHLRSLKFRDMFEFADESSPTSELAGRYLDAADIRQLTVYASLAMSKFEKKRMPTLMLMYPFVGPAAECVADRTNTWNGSIFWLMPVQVKAQAAVANAIRFPDVTNSTIVG